MISFIKMLLKIVLWVGGYLAMEYILMHYYHWSGPTVLKWFLVLVLPAWLLIKLIRLLMGSVLGQALFGRTQSLEDTPDDELNEEALALKNDLKELGKTYEQIGPDGLNTYQRVAKKYGLKKYE